MCAVLQDADLRLRPVDLPGDISLALPWYAEPEVMDLSENTTEPYGEDTVGGMYRYFQERGEVFIIEVRQPSGAWLAIGDVALTPDTVPIVIGVPAWRDRGLGRRVLGLVIQHARDLGYKRLKTKGIWVRNVRSRRLFEAAGFRMVMVGFDREGRECWFHELDLQLGESRGDRS